PACRELGVGVMPYLPLAAGLLTGKIPANGTAPDGTRLSIEKATGKRWITPHNLELVSKLDAWAKERGHNVLELAFAWLLAEPVVSSVIAGASSPAQIASNAAAGDWVITSQERLEVNAILDEHPAENGGPYYSAAPYFNQPTLEATRRN
ncbi:MAG: aldo/keto reductase, partial [Dehalococcoidia bacterium]